jgi:membrane-bound lytic murein transglycosylase D
LKEQHTKGARPSVPKSRLPEDVRLSVPNAKARRSIAEGATGDELRHGATDDELSALRQAEQVLFPRTLPGLRSGWSFELPEKEGEEGRVLGLPLTLGSDGEGSGVDPEDLSWLGTLTLPDLPVQLDRRVVTYLKFYRDSHRGRTISAIWTRKSGRYIAEMKAQFRRAGLPTDLVWLSMVESGHDPSIRSPAGAVGLWQFMPESARMYGLTVDHWVDERRDPARATQAAIRFLGDLYRRFGNWELAMGAYNMGYAGMSRAIAKYNTNDYWALSRLESGIPWETTLYVPKIFALAIVMNNRQAFGVGRTQLDPSESFDTILVSPATPLAQVASAAGMPIDALKSINPQYIASRLPPQSSGTLKKWSVKIAKNAGTRALRLLSELPQNSGLIMHKIRRGDTAERIAADYGVSEKDLLSENALSTVELLDVGTVLVLPKGAKLRNQKSPTDVIVSRILRPQDGQKVVYYHTRAHDDLDEIAHAFGVSVADLARSNTLSDTALLREGMTLQILVSKDAQLDEVRYTDGKDAHVLLAGSQEFHEYFEAIKGKKRVQITVRKGDSLSSVGQRFGMSVGSMERVNRRSRNSELVAGEHLIVYTEKAVSDSGDALLKTALPEIKVPDPDALP